MAMTADSSHQNDQSPRSLSSQNPKGLPSPWAQVVRGESDSVAPGAVANHVTIPVSGEQSTFSDCSPRKATEIPVAAAAAADCAGGDNDNVGRTAKPAWKKPVNGVTDVSPVMGAVSWPALSESTKSSPKSDTSSKIGVADGSISSPKGPVRPHSPHKQVSSNAKPNTTSNHSAPTRQRSMKRGGGSGHTQSNFSQPPPPPPPLPQFPLFPMAPNGYGSMAPPMLDQPPRGNTWEPRPVGAPVPPPQPVVNDNRHSSRRGNFGPRGDGPFRNNFGGRRDSAQPQRSPRGFVRPQAPAPAPFVPPFPVRPPFANPMGFGEYVPFTAVPMEPFRAVPYMAHPPSPMMFPVPEPPLPAMLLHQIEYYFSDANLIRDEFLKSNMDDQGWVTITLIAGFNRVKSMTTDIQLILDSLRTSTLLEVQDEKVRKRADWQKWIPGSSGHPADSSSEMLTNSLQNMTVENENNSTVESSNSVDETQASQSEVSSQGECSETASSS